MISLVGGAVSGFVGSVVNRSYRVFRKTSLNMLQLGPIPAHVAFIMDGNRRFAEREHVNKEAGHRAGYKRMLDALEWCLELGITHVTVYAFSVDNFNRTGAEVTALMNLAEEKLIEMLQDREVVSKHGVKVRVIGRLDLLPERVQHAAATVMHSTAHHTGGVLNICLCYTSRHEIAHAVGLAQQALHEGAVSPVNLTGASIDHCLSTAPSPPVDLLIRTSGEARLSDFLLRQCATAKLVFLQVLWPDLDFRHFARAILDYQQDYWELKRIRRAVTAASNSSTLQRKERADTGALASAASPQQTPQQQRGKRGAGGASPLVATATADIQIMDAGGCRRRRRSQPTDDSASEYHGTQEEDRASPSTPSTSAAASPQHPDSPLLPFLDLQPPSSADLKRELLQKGFTPFSGPVAILRNSQWNLDTPGIGGISPWCQLLTRAWIDKVLL